MSSTDLDGMAREALLEVARSAIDHGLAHDRDLEVDATAFVRALQEPRATFVTLKRCGQLRGCVGSLEARRPLIADVAGNAYAAAFRDPRFGPLARQESLDLHISVSVLSPPEPLTCIAEADLLRQLRPGIDGLILELGPSRGTFLPSVWESLPEPRTFLQQLKLKAGLPSDYWSDQVHVWRYTSEVFEEEPSPWRWGGGSRSMR